MTIFRASVQYNDFLGSAAADTSDTEDLASFLRDKGVAGERDRVFGFRFGFSGNHGRRVERPGVVVYLTDAAADDMTDDGSIRAIEVDMEVADVFKYLKRLDVVVTRHGKSYPDNAVQKIEGVV